MEHVGKPQILTKPNLFEDGDPDMHIDKRAEATNHIRSAAGRAIDVLVDNLNQNTKYIRMSSTYQFPSPFTYTNSRLNT